MGIINKQDLKKALEHPFSFVMIFLLIMLALINSFAISCLISALIGVIIAMISLTKISPDFLLRHFCNNSSWKVKGVNLLSNILGTHTILIVIIGLIVWALLNKTEKGRALLDLLD